MVLNAGMVCVFCISKFGIEIRNLEGIKFAIRLISIFIGFKEKFLFTGLKFALVFLSSFSIKMSRLVKKENKRHIIK